jgi:seryl-tRNA synthetase
MLDINYIKENPDKVRQGIKNKNLNPEVIDHLLDVDKTRRELIGKVEDLRGQRNKLTEKLKSERDQELIAKASQIKQQLKDLEPELKKVQESFDELMLQIPNIPLDDVPVGKDESGNKKVKEWGKKPEFDFEPKDHIELGLSLNMLDLERGAKVAGFRGYYLKNDGVLLQMALMQYTLNKFIQKGYTPIIPPIINNRQAFVNSGHFPWGESECYKLAEDETDSANDYFLSGTAEVPLASFYAGETLKEKDLPIKLVGISPCYRREIGNYGKDTKGFFRVHEFFKVEQVVLCKADIDESIKLHEQMLEYSQEILKDLNLHHQVLLMCTGDMGEPQAKKYDIETWMPGRNAYGETASDSIVTDFQARRANIRYQDKDGLKFPHMLNNTAAPSTRLLIAIWENYQQKDGSVKVPSVLVPFVGKEVIK